MQLQKRSYLISLLMLSLLIFLAFPQISQAVGAVSDPNQPVVIARDPQSPALIFKQHGIYFYGSSKERRIVQTGRINPEEFIIKTKVPQNSLTIQGQSPISSIIDRFAAKTRSLNSGLGLTLLQLPHASEYFQTLQALKNSSAVEYVEPNFLVKATSLPNDPYYAQQWGPKAIHADTAWDKVSLAKRAAVTIAVLDTGINAAQEDLKNSIVPGYDFVNNDLNTTDGQGHGTHVSGIAAAVVNNGVGIAGIAGGSKIMPVKVLDDSGSGSISNIILGIKYAVDHGAQVISMSLGGSGTSSAMQDAINYATNHGVEVVAASGNENGPIDLPGNCQNVITVGAIDSNLQKASYSNYGPELDVMAPGSQIYSTYIGGPSSYTTMSGTSMATPFVSGVVALIKAANPSLAPAAITNILQQTATDLGNPGFDNNYGYGLVNADKAVSMALNGTSSSPAPVPTPTPIPVPVPIPVPSPTPTPAPIIPGANLALNRPATASSVEGFTRTADKAFDGSSSTRWASQEGIDPQWITVDLGKSYNINKIVLNWERAYAKSYQVQVSYDKTTWMTVYSTSSGIGGITTLTGSVNGRYVRIFGTQRGLPYGYSLWEIGVYGS